MAEEDEANQMAENEAPTGDEDTQTPGKETPTGGSLLKLALLVGVGIGAAGAGYAVAMLLRGGVQQARASDSPEVAPNPLAPVHPSEDYVYYKFEAITVNLNEPRLARYVRATLTLAIRLDNESEVVLMLDKKKPALKSWLTLYLSGCTLEDVRGPQNLNRIRREILDSLNELLWPEQKPMIEQIHFDEFAVQ